MLLNIIFILLIAANLVVMRLGASAQDLFWSLYGFLFWSVFIISLSIFNFGILSVALAVLWIHGLLKYRPVLKRSIAEPYIGNVIESSILMPQNSTPKPKIDPKNIQGSFYGLSGYTSNPYERIEI